MPEIRIRLFGGPEASTPEGPVALTPHQACLVTLAAAWGPRGVPRSRVIRLFWEDSDTPQARHRLRQLLHGLRGRLGADVLGPAEADPLRLPTGTSDLEEWETKVRSGALAEAASILAHGFAARLDDPPSRGYADWLAGRRQALRTRLRERASAGWDRCRKASLWHEGRDAAEALYVLDPTSEAHLRCVLEARAMTGDVQAAEAAYADFVARLDPAAAPCPATRELMERIRTLPAEGARLMAGSTQGPPVPLVGRATVLQDLEGCLERVAAGRVELALLTGEGGIGKTRILDEIRRRARLAGFRVLSASPVQVEQRLPLSAMADALGVPEIRDHVAGLSEPWRTLVAAFLPTHEGISTLPEVPPIQESGLSRRLLDAFSFLLADVARDQPTLLAMDDLQWADDTTLAVLQSVKRRWEGGTLGIIGTVRPPRELGRRWPSPYLNQLMALASYRRELPGLSDEEARSLIQATAGRPLGTDGEERLAALGGRNPFFLIELTRDHLAGRLPLSRAPGEPLPLPISLQELFEHRLDTLSGAARAAAEVLAIRGRPTPMTELAALTESSLKEAVLAVEDLLRQRLVEVDRGLVSTSHELFRSAFYQQISPARLALRHLQVARHLQAQDGPVPHGELALHLSLGGEAPEAAHHGRVAADQAVENGAIAEATHLLRIVVDNEPDETLRAEATAELARLLHVSRDMERAAPLLASAADQLRLVGRRTQALRLDIRRVESMVEASGTPVGEAVERLTLIKEEARREGDWVAVAMALDTEMHLLHQVGDISGIQGTFGELRACVSSGDREAECLANASLAMSILFGDPGEGLTAAREAVRIAEEEEYGQHLLKAQTRLIVVLLYQGRLALAGSHDLVTSARRRAVRTGDLGQRIMLEANLGSFFADEGHLALAEETYEGIAPAFRNAEARIPKFNFFVNRGALARRQYQPERARGFLDQAAELLVSEMPDYMVDALHAEYGLTALLQGDLSEARLRGEQLRGSENGPIHFDPISSVTFRTRMSRRSGTEVEWLDQLRAIADRLDGSLTWPWLRVGVLECELASRTKQSDKVRYGRYLSVAEDLQLQGVVQRLKRLSA